MEFLHPPLKTSSGEISEKLQISIPCRGRKCPGHKTCHALNKGRKRNHKQNFLWPKMATLAPCFWPQKSPRKKIMWVPFLRPFPGNEAHKLFSGGPNSAVLGGGPKSLFKKMYVLFSFPDYKSNLGSVMAFQQAPGERRKKLGAGTPRCWIFLNSGGPRPLVSNKEELSAEAGFLKRALAQARLRAWYQVLFFFWRERVLGIL